MSQRLYVVINDDTRTHHLVSATSQAQAVHHIAHSMLRVAIAKPMEIVDLMRQGIVPTDAAVKS